MSTRDIYKDKVEISVVTLIEMKRAFHALIKDSNSYLYKVFPDDYVFDAIKEVGDAYTKYMSDGSK